MGRIGGWRGTSQQGVAEYSCLGTFLIYTKYQMVWVSLNAFSDRVVKLGSEGFICNRRGL